MKNRIQKKAFTLLELIIVISVSTVLIVTLGGGLLSLQNSIKLDNSIRDLKIEIQSAQNTARNSFVVYDQSSNFGSSTDIFNSGRVSLGWLISFENASSSTVKVTRQSLYFKPPSGYDFNSLREEVINFRKLINQKKFYCDNSKFFASLSSSGFQEQSNYVSITSGNPQLTIECSVSSFSNTGEFFTSTFAGVNLATTFGTNSIPTCWDEVGRHQSIYFTSGYGEPVVNYVSSAGPSDCQIQLENRATIGAEKRSIKVSYQTGVVEVCGAYCTK